MTPRMDLGSKLNFKHLIIRLILFGGLTYVIMRFIIVFFIWGYVGDGEYPKSWDVWINATYGLSAIIFLFPFLIFRIVVNYKRKIAQKVNDYFIVGLFVIIMSVLLYKLT